MEHKINCVETGRDTFFDLDHLAKKVVQLINAGDYFQQNTSIRNSLDSLGKASNTLEKAQDFFYEKLKSLVKSTEELDFAVKKSTSKAKDASQKMADELKKLDQSINVDRLERQVQLLERVADAMERLNSLQQTGRLNKILEAIK